MPMKWTGYQNLSDRLKKFLGISDNKSYLVALVNNLEQQRYDHKTLPFRIFGSKEKGFVVKTGGLFAYASFYHMPWDYPRQEDWQTIFPYLKDRTFYCKIHSIRKEPLFILIDGKIPQFKQPVLNLNDLYLGIVLRKTSYSLFVDIGFHFDWECGSLTGWIRRSGFENKTLFDQTVVGQSTEVLFLGYDDRNQCIFGSKPVEQEWFTGELASRVGEMVWVKVSKQADERPVFRVEGKFAATMLVSNKLYPGKRVIVARAIANLSDGEIIRCEILSLNERSRKIQIKWALDWEIEAVASRVNQQADQAEPPSGSGNPEPLQNLYLAGKQVKVLVIKQKDRFGRLSNRYLIEDKYDGFLHIEKSNYRLSKREKELIEEELRDGDILEGEVIRIDQNGITVKWVIPDS